MPMNRELLDAFLDIQKNRRSGVLRFERGPEKKQLILNKGLLDLAESNLPEEHLARFLVRLDLLPRAKVSEIASLMKTGKTSEEAILALPGSDTQSLKEGRHAQAISILATLWIWDKCNVRFFPGDRLVRSRLNLSLPLSEALVLAARHAASSGLMRMPKDFMQGFLRKATDCPAVALNLPLNRYESYAYSLLQQSVGGSDVLGLLSGIYEKPEEVLVCLFLLGMIEVEQVADRTDKSNAEVSPSPVVQQLDELLLTFENSSLYKVLSVEPEASPDEIQAAYHRMAKQYHPDRFQSREFSEETRGKIDQVFTLINQAYITLKDPVFRADYDKKRKVSESKVEVGLKARAAKKSEDEKTAEALYCDGRALLLKGDAAKAVERLKGSVWLDPEKAVYHHYLGLAESEIPRLRKSAERHFMKAIELNNTTTASRLELAKLYLKVQLWRKAEQQLNDLMHWDPENLEAQRLLAEMKKR